VGEGWRRYFPPGCLDPRPDLHRLSAEHFADALGRLDEPPLYPAGSDQPLVVRLLCLPTWRPACSVRVEPSGVSWQLAARELSGKEAGFDLGRLARRVDRVLAGDEAARVSELWAYLRLWALGPAPDGDDVLDGTLYAVEAAERGRYHVARRTEPVWGDTLGEFADLLVRLAGLAPR
jgi:hypothetical protein